MKDINNNLIQNDNQSQNNEVKKEPTLSEIFDFIKLQDTKISSLQGEITALKSIKQEVKKENTVDNIVKKQENTVDNIVKKQENSETTDKQRIVEEIKKEIFFDSLNENQRKIIEENPELANLSVNSLKKIFQSQVNNIVNPQNIETDKKKLSGVEIKENKVTDVAGIDDVYETKKRIDEQNGIKDTNVFKTKIIR